MDCLCPIGHQNLKMKYKIRNSQFEPTGKEWKLLEKAVLASVEEQRRARRWVFSLNF